MPDIFDTLDKAPAPTSAESKAKPWYRPKEITEGLKIAGKEIVSPEALKAIKEQLIQKTAVPAARGASAAIGGIGSLASILHEQAARPAAKAVFGKEMEPYEEQWGKILPTQAKVMKGFENVAGQELKPKTPGEEIIATTADFLGSAVGLGAKGLGTAGRIPFTSKTMPAAVKTVLNAFAPAAAFIGAKKAELPPWMQASVTIATSLLTHRLTNKSLKTISSELYTKRNELAKDVMLKGEPIVEDLNSLYGEMQKGGLTSVEKQIMTFLDPLKAKAKGGAIQLDEVMTARSKLFQESKMFTKEQRKASEFFWNKAERILDKGIKSYKNPEFQSINSEANSLYKGLKEARKIETFIKSHKALSGAAIGAGGWALKLISAAIGVKPTVAVLGAKAYLFTKAMTRNPGFRKAYKDVLRQAANENLKGTATSLARFNTIAKHEGLGEEGSKKDIFDQLD